MKIQQLLDKLPIMLTNEEKDFVDNHPHDISINGLYNRDRVVAQTLVRKGVYEISKDSKKLELRDGQTNSQNTI